MFIEIKDFNLFMQVFRDMFFKVEEQDYKINENICSFVQKLIDGDFSKADSHMANLYRIYNDFNTRVYFNKNNKKSLSDLGITFNLFGLTN